MWDTVAAMGAPAAIPGTSQINSGVRFHDPSITAFIERARHAVAIDERRVLFPPVLFGDLTKLNAQAGFKLDHIDAPYQERWFPGVHGSVGGGGDIRGLSDGSLEWILFGAKQAGLSLDISANTRIFSLRPDPFAPLVNTTLPLTGFLDLTAYKWKNDRKGPEAIWQLSNSTLRRFKADASKLPDKVPYSPKTLENVKAALESYQLVSATEIIELQDLRVVAAGDSLYKFAEQYYGDKSKFGVIFDANRDVLDDYRQIAVGTELRIPKLPAAGNQPALPGLA